MKWNFFHIFFPPLCVPESTTLYVFINNRVYVTKLYYFIRIKGTTVYYCDCWTVKAHRHSIGFKITNKNNKRKFTLLNNKKKKEKKKNTWKTPSITFLYDWHNSHIKCTSCKTREGNEIEKDSFSLLCYAIKTHFPFSRNVPCRHFPNIAAFYFVNSWDSVFIIINHFRWNIVYLRKIEQFSFFFLLYYIRKIWIATLDLGS